MCRTFTSVRSGALRSTFGHLASLPETLVRPFLPFSDGFSDLARRRRSTKSTDDPYCRPMRTRDRAGSVRAALPTVAQGAWFDAGRSDPGLGQWSDRRDGRTPAKAAVVGCQLSSATPGMSGPKALSGLQSLIAARCGVFDEFIGVVNQHLDGIPKELRETASEVKKHAIEEHMSRIRKRSKFRRGRKVGGGACRGGGETGSLNGRSREYLGGGTPTP